MFCILWHNFNAKFPYVSGRKEKYKNKMLISSARGAIKISPLRSVFKSDCGVIDITKNPFYHLYSNLSSNLLRFENGNIIDDLAYHILWFKNKEDILRLKLDEKLYKKTCIQDFKYVGAFECDSIDIFRKPTEELITNIRKSIEYNKPYNSVLYHLKYGLNKLEDDEIVIKNKKTHINKINYVYNNIDQIIDNEKAKREILFIDYLNFLKLNIKNWSSDISFGQKFKLFSDIDNFFID